MELTILTFALMALIVVMTPGPTVLLALSNGSRFGLGRAGYGILGAALSDAVLVTASGLGLGAVLAASAFWFAVVKWIGVAYLVWLGVQMLRSSGKIGIEGGGVAFGGRFAVFRKSFLVAVTNPKGYLFVTAFFPQFLVMSDPLVPQYLMLAAVFIAIDVVVMSLYAGLGVKAARFLSRKGALWIDRLCGGLLVAMGGALSLLRRSGA